MVNRSIKNIKRKIILLSTLWSIYILFSKMLPPEGVFNIITDKISISDIDSLLSYIRISYNSILFILLFVTIVILFKIFIKNHK